MTVYRLSDPTNPKIELFKFKLEQRVCKSFEDRALDQAACGKIIEGFITEDEQSEEIFEEEYTVELEEGIVRKLRVGEIAARDS